MCVCEREREIECVCVCVCVRERERERGREGEREKGIERVRLCERAREKAHRAIVVQLKVVHGTLAVRPLNCLLDCPPRLQVLSRDRVCVCMRERVCVRERECVCV